MLRAEATDGGLGRGVAEPALAGERGADIAGGAVETGDDLT